MSQMENIVLTLGKTRKTPLLALALLVALVVILSLPRPHDSNVLAQRPGAAAPGAGGAKPGAGGAKPGAPAGMPAIPSLLVRVDMVGVLDHTQPVPKVGNVARLRKNASRKSMHRIASASSCPFPRVDARARVSGPIRPSTARGLWAIAATWALQARCKNLTAWPLPEFTAAS